jgi:pyridoxine 5-phosphate synthase
MNVGHDLNLDNLQPLMAALPPIAETSIDHELTADALELGFGLVIIAYNATLGGTTVFRADSRKEQLFDVRLPLKS